MVIRSAICCWVNETRKVKEKKGSGKGKDDERGERDEECNSQHDLQMRYRTDGRKMDDCRLASRGFNSSIGDV